MSALDYPDFEPSFAKPVEEKRPSISALRAQIRARCRE